MSSSVPRSSTRSTTGAIAIGSVAVASLRRAAAHSIAVAAKAVRPEASTAKSPARALVHREFRNRTRWRDVILRFRQRRANQRAVADPSARKVTTLVQFSVPLAVAIPGLRVGSSRRWSWS